MDARTSPITSTAPFRISCLDLLLGTYNLLDLTPLGRHEEGLPFSMAWVKLHDSYAAPR